MRVMPTPSRTMDLDPTWTYQVRAPRTRHSSHQGNLTNPHSTFPVHDHSFIHSHACIHTIIHTFIHSYIHSFMHSSIYSSHTSKHRICNYCFTMLHAASRSDSRLIRYERRPTEVRRPAHEGLEATSRQTELGEKT